MQFTKVHQKLARPVYEAIPKIAEKAGKKWKWDPKTGEFFLCKTEYMDQGKTIRYDRLMLVPLEFRIEKTTYSHNEKAGQSLIIDDKYIPLGACVPLLHWEDHLEPILEGFGWDLWNMERTVPSSDGTGSLVVVDLAKGKLLRCGRGKDRQEAFQRAVLSVVKELEAKEEA